MISLAGLLISQNPTVKAAAEERLKTQKLESELSKTDEAMTAAVGAEMDMYKKALSTGELPSDKELKAHTAEQDAARKTRTKTTKSLFELSPTKESYSRMRQAARSEQTVLDRRAEVQKSREFAKMITEGVETSFNPDTYVPPKAIKNIMKMEAGE